MKQVAGRRDFIDYIKAVAIILVIIQHTCGGRDFNPFILNYIIRMAVPLFVLVSGFNFSGSITRLSSWKEWYSKNRVLRKLRAWILPMLGVFVLYTVLKIVTDSDFTVIECLKAFIFQNYGPGSYYCFIVIGLYFMFPIVYALSRRRGGYLCLAVIGVLYEITLNIVPIPEQIYRILALRYILHLSCGIWIFDNLQDAKRLNQKRITVIMLVAFMLGCAYLSFATRNAYDTDVFRYGTWGLTNVFSCLYIVPIFYLLTKLFKDSKLKCELLHNCLRKIGNNTYYILYTQMVMFWVVDVVRGIFSIPLIIQVIVNVCLGCASGVLLGNVIEYFKKRLIEN